MSYSRSAGSHENWGNFKCDKWGEYGRHSQMACLGEQVPDFGNAFGPPPFQQNAEIRRGGRGWRHCVDVRQIDATNPTFDPSATKTELASDLPTALPTSKRARI